MSTKSGANAVHGSGDLPVYKPAVERRIVLYEAGRYQQIAAARAAGNNALADELATSQWCRLGPQKTSPDHGQRYRCTFPKSSTAGTSYFSSSGSRGCGIGNRPGPARSTTRCRRSRCGGVIFRNCCSFPTRSLHRLRSADCASGPGAAGTLGPHAFPGNVIPQARIKNPIYDFYRSGCRCPTTIRRTRQESR